jgi:uncharacterized protein YkvS
MVRAEIGSVKEEVAGLRDIVERIDKNIAVIAEACRPSTDDAGQE